MNDELRQYTHTPLPADRFRLIKLLDPASHAWPGDETAHEPLCAEFVESSFGEVISYEALSYCWTGHQRAILAEERDVHAQMDRRLCIKSSGRTAGFIPISRSLEAALRHVQHQTEKPLFVDQVCINQSDLEEKSHLVQRMGDIYTNAERVLAWLGPPTPESGEFMSFMQNLKEGPSTAFHRLSDIDYTSFATIRASILDEDPDVMMVPEELKADRDELQELATRIWDALPLRGFVDFCSRQWFGRMWIVQESCLPKHLVFVFGDRVCDSTHFERTALLVVLSVGIQAERWTAELQQRDYPKVDDLTYTLALTRYVNRIFSVRRTLHRDGEERLGLFHLLSKFNVADTVTSQTVRSDLQKFRASNPRDCYYSLLALPRQDDAAIREVVVDYRKPVQLVFIDLASALVKEHTDVLLFSQTSRKRLGGLPSWVADWTSELSSPYGYHNSTTAIYSAGVAKDTEALGAAPDAHVVAANLVVRGYTVGPVEHVGNHVYEISEDGLQTSFSLHLFLSEISHFCNLARGKQTSFETSPHSGDEMASLLASGGRGISTKPNASPSDRLGPIIHGTYLAGAVHNVTKRRYARHARVLERAEFSKRMAAILDRLEARWQERQGPYYALMRLLGLDEDWEDFEFYQKFSDRWDQLGDTIKNWDPDDFQGLHPELRDAADGMMGRYGRALDVQEGRKCFITPSGYVGLGPGEMEAGDFVVVLKDASVPMVLRPDISDSSGHGQFTYVGEAYCYGIMDGEIMEQRREDEPRTFYIG
ncbi:uncharacterized protein DNG_06368 [Cephalotrichum gorgonifer]|uniref:Heterokaryon incompatibility domain-containing protein n=1 Tax=Cephalotrichum gorgonifer TaxID=2041049 RepID=A0AAE8N2K4_9PEZI|nr:uncharacterized protein DNG_06368 [Cephalotrichum gorgonifer]